LDNTSYLARSDEGEDLPIRRYVDEAFHIEGDLILAGKDRQYMTFQNIEPLLRILEGWRVFLLTAMPRFLREACCDELEHAPNRYTPGFEDRLWKNLAEFRANHKDFLFTKGFRGFKVLDPSPSCPTSRESSTYGETIRCTLSRRGTREWWISWKRRLRPRQAARGRPPTQQEEWSRSRGPES
jgi:hypothetical protein